MALTKITSRMTDDTIPQKTAHGAMKLPVGTTTQRPTGEAGDLRYNSTTDKFEGYTTEWKPLGLDKAPTPTLSSSAESEITVTNHSSYNSPTYRVKLGTEELTYTISGDTITITGGFTSYGSQTISVEIDDFGDFRQLAPSDAGTVTVTLPTLYRYYRINGLNKVSAGPYLADWKLSSTPSSNTNYYTFADSAFSASYWYNNSSSYQPSKVNDTSMTSGWWILSSPNYNSTYNFYTDYIAIDAGAPIVVKAFKIKWYTYNYHSTAATLQGSNDNSSWTTLATRTGMTSGGSYVVNV